MFSFKSVEIMKIVVPKPSLRKVIFSDLWIYPWDQLLKAYSTNILETSLLKPFTIAEDIL